jgi:predicted RNase H-like HicB family nuclease
MAHSQARVATITIMYQHRGDGGLRVKSDDVPGLHLSGADPDEVWADIKPAIEMLFRDNHGIEVEVWPMVDSVHEIIAEPAELAPRSLVAAAETGHFAVKRAA